MPPRYRILIQPRALNDLVAICAYIQKNSPQNAATIADELLDAIDSLDFLPRRCKIHRSHRNPKLIVRSMSIRPFIIYYRVSERQKSVDIIAVIHGARIQPREFD